MSDSKVVVAIPTIEDRGELWQDTAKAWRHHTSQPIEIVPSWAPGGWAAGLNAVYNEHPDADIFVCGSDDIIPVDDFWLPCVESFLERNLSPVPMMLDPRFVIQGGVISDEEREDGAESHMSNLPILRGDWLDKVLPLPADLHYFSDNLASTRLHKIGVKTVYAKSFVVRHLWDPRGRGAGMLTEENRMQHDRALYKRYQADA